MLTLQEAPVTPEAALAALGGKPLEFPYSVLASFHRLSLDRVETVHA